MTTTRERRQGKEGKCSQQWLSPDLPRGKEDNRGEREREPSLISFFSHNSCELPTSVLLETLTIIKSRELPSSPDLFLTCVIYTDFFFGHGNHHQTSKCDQLNMIFRFVQHQHHSDHYYSSSSYEDFSLSTFLWDGST